MKKLIAGAAIAAVIVLAACNTTAGVGKDVQAVGVAIEKVATPKAK